MARFNFRHGIARYQEDGFGGPAFLQPSNGGSYIDLIVSPDPTVFCAAHYDADYMITENASKTKAWGPFSTGTNYWLYWNVNFQTGELTRGFTTLEPHDGTSAPPSPLADQHWFDPNEKVQKVWSGSTWVEVIRVFAAYYTNGSVLTYFPKNSQVGLNNVRSYAGTPLFDPDGVPLQKFQRNRRGQFITTETDLHSQFSRISNFRVEAAVVQAESTEEIPIHHCVAYFDFDSLVLARSTDPNRPAIGISMEEMNTNEIRSFITKGYVTNEVDWNWSAYDVGTPLFCGMTGQLTPIAPIAGMIQQVATVVNVTTVFVDVKQQIVLGSNTNAPNTIPIFYDSNTGKFKGGNGGSNVAEHVLGSHVDVDIVAPQEGQSLTYNSTTGEWINSTVSGGGGTDAIGWVPDGGQGQYRLSSTFTEGANTFTIRAVDFDTNDKLRIELANFNPILSATDQNLFWDQDVTSFTVVVDNPSDFPSQWIDSVISLSGVVGMHPTLGDYNIGPKLPTPAGGVDWTQTFTTNFSAKVLSNSSNLSGGSATGTISFVDDQASTWTDTATINFTWQNANVAIAFGSLSGNNFLETYSSVPYVVTITGLQTANNAFSVVTPTGGTVSNINGNGTFTFTDELHKDNNVGRSVAVATDFTRPANVTGTEYTVQDGAADTTIAATFGYPSVYIWLTDTLTPPTRADMVSGSAFSGSVIELGTVGVDQMINNSSALPQGFWFAIRSATSQPTIFQTGPSPSLLSDVAVVTGNVVDLEPDVPPVGYIAEEYTLYGITLQPGNTYVRIV